MQMHRQELLRTASRRMRRGKRTTGRIVASALGFAMAYYFDPENGELRRKRLHRTAQGALHAVEGRLAGEVTDADPPAVFHPVQRTGPTASTARTARTGSRPWERAAAH